jgi:hypothetical protein
MKLRNILSITAAVLVVSLNGSAYGLNEVAYNDAVRFIATTMAGATSDARKESYNYIRFDKCKMEYNVLGTYPVGELYDTKFSNIDFATLNPRMSRTGHDYTAFIQLNFASPLRSKGNFNEMALSNLVVNVSSDEKAQLLFKAFLYLGELCGASQNP